MIAAACPVICKYGYIGMLPIIGWLSPVSQQEVGVFAHDQELMDFHGRIAEYVVFFVDETLHGASLIAGGAGFEPAHAGVKVPCLYRLGEPPMTPSGAALKFQTCPESDQGPVNRRNPTDIDGGSVARCDIYRENNDQSRQGCMDILFHIDDVVITAGRESRDSQTQVQEDLRR